METKKVLYGRAVSPITMCNNKKNTYNTLIHVCKA